MSKLLFCLIGLIMSFVATAQQPEKFRLSYRDDPATTMGVAWSKVSGTIYYDTTDHGTNHNAYAFSQGVDRQTFHLGMDHYFVRLNNLQPNTVYYFVVRYAGVANTARYSFKTLSDNSNLPVSFISGGDSRKGTPPVEICNCRQARQVGNRLVAKIRPDFIAFNGDYTRGQNIPLIADKEDDWKEWLNDWQLTIAPDGRISPMVHTLGNHEDANDIDLLFDIPYTDVYYATNFCGDLFRLYTLNSETDPCTDVVQKAWLNNDLQQYSAPSNTPYWKIAQYHRPMIAHYSGYGTDEDRINCWADKFEPNGVRLVLESHAHLLKTTYPLSYSTATGNYKNMLRNDSTGTVFIGDGSWGAPLRSTISPIQDVTQDTESKDAFFYITVNKDSIQVRTVLFENEAAVDTMMDDVQGSGLPAGITYWAPANGGGDIVIKNPAKNDGVFINKLAKVEEKNANLSPNPASKFVTVSFKKPLIEEVTIEIYDGHGKRCQQITNVNGQELKVDISNLCPGVNYINIISKDDVESHKLIIAE